MALVRISPPDTRLKQIHKLARQALTAPDAIARAEAAASEAIENARASVLAELAEVDALVRERPANVCSEVYRRCHTIRGLAGTVGLSQLGFVAKAMCQLLDGVDDTAPVDPNLLTSIAVTMLHAARDKTNDPALMQELLEACFEAVRHVRPEVEGA